MVTYICQLCSFEVSTVKSYLMHYKLHKNVKNLVFPCCFAHCNRTFVKFTSLKCHLTRDHGPTLQISKNMSCVQSAKDFMSNDNFICCLESCKMKLESLKDLISHCKKHISSGQPMQCPVLGCEGLFTKHTSYTSHISRKHETSCTGSRFKDLFRQSKMECVILSDSSGANVSSTENAELENRSVSDPLKAKPDMLVFLKRSLALYYMKMEAVHLIPITTINSIMSDVTDLHNLSLGIINKKLNETMNVEDTHSKLNISQIIERDDFKTLLSGNNSTFNSNFKRKRFFKRNFRYIEPIELYLGLDENNKRCVYHYVPIKLTLKALLEDESVLSQIKKPLACENEVFTDITDGNSYKTNTYFQKNKDSLKIILYQDAFEIVNPLGSAKKTFKLIGFYYSLTDIYPYNRSKIDPLQLALLCREKDFLYFDNGKKVVRCLVNEIKELSNGLSINGVFVKANLVCVLGDNLGSHFIGGFCTNFSSGSYYCRYCLMTKESYQTDPSTIRNSELRTVDNFEHSVKVIEEKSLNHHQGIKCNSILNELSGFHVVNPGLPPCLGHDLFEGVIKYDLALLLKTLINTKKWFDLKTLNYCISTFAFKAHDLDNKPIPIKAKCDNIGGHAVQTWTLLRLLPIIICQHVKNFEDEIWKCILLLRLITEYLCSSKISVNQVAIVQQLIDDYIELRQTLFPDVNLRPKHHYFHHYPHLITQFGPLLRVWTMRFESKHSYFKRCIRSSKNFRNVTKTLSEKHQLLQAYYAAGNLFQSEKFIEDESENFLQSLVGTELFHIICKKVKNVNDVRISRSVTIHGYSIKSGNCVLVDCESGCVGFGQVQFFIIENSTLKLLCKYIQTQSVNGLYRTNFEEGKLVLIDETDVLDLCPLNLYNNFLALKYHPFDKWA